MPRLALALFFFALPAFGSALRIYYSANRQGELDPCGCAVNQIGGIGRLQNFMDAQARSQSSDARAVFFGDAGDTFFSAPQLSAQRLSEELLRATTLAKSMRLLGLNAFTPGERDFTAGLATLRDLVRTSGAVLVSANLTGRAGKLLFERFHVFEEHGKKIAVTGVTDESALKDVAGLKVAPVVPALKAALEEMKSKKPDVLVLLSHLGLKRDRQIAAEEPSFDVIIGSHSLDALSDPVVVGRTWIVQPLPQGEQVGFIDIDNGKRSHHIVDLGKEWDADNAASHLVESYRSQLHERALAQSEKVGLPSSDKPYVANYMYCRNCHPKQVDFWMTTKHASAYLVLYAKNEHFDPECISCHSLGFETPGGFSRIAQPLTLNASVGGKEKKGSSFVEDLMKKVFAAEAKLKPLDSRREPARYARLKKRYHEEVGKLLEADEISHLYIGVQCEHCHGNRNGHPSPDVPTVKRVSEKTCRGCHTPPHDTTFNFKKMVKAVACPPSEKNSG